jgi:hypothetical protein
MSAQRDFKYRYPAAAAAMKGSAEVGRTGAIHVDRVLHERPNLMVGEAQSFQLVTDLRHRGPPWACVPAELKGVRIAPRETLVVAPFVREGQQPIRRADIQSVVRQRPQELVVLGVSVGNGSRQHHSYDGGESDERVDDHG